jgi:hypothetical protein
MANFVLTRVSPGVWTGSANASVTIDVRSANANATTMNSAAYPDGTALKKNADGTATLKIAADGKPHDLSVDIVPAVPPDDWTIVEVGADKTTQNLLGLVAGQPLGGVTIQPKP